MGMADNNKKDRRGYSSCDGNDIPIAATTTSAAASAASAAATTSAAAATHDHHNSDQNNNNNNYTDYVSSRCSSFEIDENSATLPRSNKKQHPLLSSVNINNFNSNNSPVVELSSLFRSTESRHSADDDNDYHRNNGSELMEGSEKHSKLLFMEDDNENNYSDSSTPPRRRQQRENGMAYQSFFKNKQAKSSSSPQQSPRKINNGGGGWGSFIMRQPSFSNGLNNSSSAGAGAANVMGTPGESWALGSIREEGSDEEDEDPIMEVMDYLEDEIDEHTYDELIPLQIRMALEDQVFGWDHFFSNILGHVGFTVGSYLLTFWIITFIVLHQVPWGNTNTDGDKVNNPWGMPHELFSFIRTALSIGSAISTFRTIRRRRRVWLRQPYGSSGEYELAPGSREAQRHQSSLEEADRRARRFVLGSKLWAKMQRSYTKRRNRYLSKSVHRKLLKAQKMFERRHHNRVKLIRSTSASSLVDADGSGKKKRAVASALTRHGHESSHHERVRILAAAPGGGGISNSSSIWEEDDVGSVGGGSSVGAGSTSLTEDPMDYHSFGPRRNTMDSRTMPNFAMESVSHDQMPFAHGEIKKIPYVHGGFFGAAPFMLTNPHWIAILRVLMPDVYVEISRRASYAPAPRLIHWAENNPVVAAYGTAHEIEFSGKVPTLEWDVFLDPYLVRRVEIVLSEKESFLQRQKDARKKPRESKTDEKNADGTEDEDGKVMETPVSQSTSTPISAADERLVLSYYDKEIKRRTTILVERMLIAHGNIAQLFLEQTGYFKKYNFSRVKRTRKTLGGGIFARQWLAIYSEAMKLGMGYDEDVDDEVSDSGTDGSLEDRDDFDFYKEADFTETKDDGDRNDATPVHSRRDFISPDSKSVTQSLDAGVFSTPTHEEHGGPPRKIVMMRSNDESDDGMSTDGSVNSEPSSRKLDHTPRRSVPRRKRRSGRMTPTQILERVDATSLNKASVCPTSLNKASVCSDRSISDSISILKPIMQCSAPFGLVLDMKSRHVSRRVWALVIDFLRDSGARVEGIASFIVEEVRDITQYCSSSVNEIVFIHTAGNMQHGCHNGEIRRGDKVFFNAGSLLWDYPNLYDADVVKNILWHRFQPCFDGQEIKEGYRLKPYARITKSSRASPKNHIPDSESEYCDESTLEDDGDSVTSDLFARLMIDDRKRKSLSETDFVYEEAPDGICSTIQQYKEHYGLSIGLYVQEFAIDEVAISLIVKYVNSNLHVFDLGLSWGGINGLTVKGIQPGRFTATDGLWNQRYGDMPWKKELKPGTIFSTE